MANKEEFLTGLFDTFYVYNPRGHTIEECKYEDGQLSSRASGFRFIEENLPNSKVHEVEEMYFLNNLYQRYWSHPVMAVYQDSTALDGEEMIGTESLASLRDRLHLIKGKYVTPILHMDDIIRTIDTQNPRGDNFNAHLYRIEFPFGTYSPQEESLVSKYLMNKNDFSQIVKRKSLDLKLEEIE